MNINIQISDELVHRIDDVSTPSVTVSSNAPAAYVTSDAISGGAAPGTTNGAAPGLAQTHGDAFSAGSAEQQIASMASNFADLAHNDGGGAPR